MIPSKYMLRIRFLSRSQLTKEKKKNKYMWNINVWTRSNCVIDGNLYAIAKSVDLISFFSLFLQVIHFKNEWITNVKWNIFCAVKNWLNNHVDSWNQSGFYSQKQNVIPFCWVATFFLLLYCYYNRLHSK